MKIIPTENLKFEDVPDENSNINRINSFAIKFDINEVSDKKINFTLEDDFENLSAIELRYLLYIEQRRWNHFGRDYDKNTEKKIRLLIKTLKNKIL